MDNLTRWGIIGPGKIAAQFAGDLTIAKNKQVVSAVYGKSEESIREFTDQFEVEHTYQDEDEFIRDRKFDVVYIATPHTYHYQQTLKCLEAGIPVLCEKPITMNDEQCGQLKKTAKENKVFLMEGMWIRFLPSINQVLRLLKADKIGKVMSLHASIGFKAEKDSNNRFFDPKKGGGSLADLGIYPLFLSHLILGKPSTINAVASLSYKKVDERCAALLGYDDGKYAVLESTLMSDLNIPAEIRGEKGVIRILSPWYEESKGVELEIYGEDKDMFPTKWEGHGLQFEADEVVDCMNNKRLESEWLPLSTSIEILAMMAEIRAQIGVSYKSAEKV